MRSVLLSLTISYFLSISWLPFPMTNVHQIELPLAFSVISKTCHIICNPLEVQRNRESTLFFQTDRVDYFTFTPSPAWSIHFTALNNNNATQTKINKHNQP
ncbi:hypothetical protein BC939DRAFT_455800 [Gamsiella multidivaricata]|uniref:uncharacterized protein n=1 Tax=Gamsiella multidivaricata TaxID=101098 RepID=UPI0022200BA4|nr:uncharacterized protein BC939DRAFT_455800 [Gamsiella multidivaricata]KAI7821358.1 hypothetical protein BC939DRAFT_455800 [Gamsiella multidivaricata]